MSGIEKYLCFGICTKIQVFIQILKNMKCYSAIVTITWDLHVTIGVNMIQHAEHINKKTCTLMSLICVCLLVLKCDDKSNRPALPLWCLSVFVCVHMSEHAWVLHSCKTFKTGMPECTRLWDPGHWKTESSRENALALYHVRGKTLVYGPACMIHKQMQKNSPLRSWSGRRKYVSPGSEGGEGGKGDPGLPLASRLLAALIMPTYTTWEEWCLTAACFL